MSNNRKYLGLFDRKDILFLLTAAAVIASIGFPPFILLQQHQEQAKDLNVLLNQTSLSAVKERGILQDTLVSLFISENSPLQIESNDTHYMIYDKNSKLVATIEDI